MLGPNNKDGSLLLMEYYYPAIEGSSCIGIRWSIVCLRLSVYGQTRHEVMYVGTLYKVQTTY